MIDKTKCSDCPKICTTKRMRKSQYDKRFLCWSCYYHENEKMLLDDELVTESKPSETASVSDLYQMGDYRGRPSNSSRIARDLANKINLIKAEQKLKEKNRK